MHKEQSSGFIHKNNLLFLCIKTIFHLCVTAGHVCCLAGFVDVRFVIVHSNRVAILYTFQVSFFFSHWSDLSLLAGPSAKHVGLRSLIEHNVGLKTLQITSKLRV